jgi:thymidylate synthase ThyX
VILTGLCLMELSLTIYLGKVWHLSMARMVLPQSTMTEWYWSGSLDAFADMCNLRCAPDTQYETRLVAEQISVEMGLRMICSR